MKIKWKNILVGAAFFLLSQSCSDVNNEVSFYHWKSQWSVENSQESILNKYKVEKIYLRIFDVDLDEKTALVQPQSVVKIDSFPNTLREIIPVVFISNRSILGRTAEEIRQLTQKIQSKIEEQIRQIRKTNKVQCIQFDCDWSEESRSAYFQMLRQFKEKLKAIQVNRISVTLRLHQVKYSEQTGVPPADEAVLMFYNTGDLTNVETENSILDIETAQKYVKGFSNYPIRFDLALALYSWTLQYRHGHIIQILPNAYEEVNSSKLCEKIADDRYKVRKSHYIKGQYVYKGDLLKIEKVNKKQIKQVLEWMREHRREKDFTIIYYHLDPDVLAPYSKENLKHWN